MKSNFVGLWSSVVQIGAIMFSAEPSIRRSRCGNFSAMVYYSTDLLRLRKISISVYNANYNVNVNSFCENWLKNF